MKKSILVAAAIAAGAVMFVAPVANADPSPDDPYGWNAYQDRTDSFVSPLDPGAYFDPAKVYKSLLISPYGTSHYIECRGDGHYVKMHDCRQYDDNGNPHNLNLVANPIRPLYIYN
ncbi:hypothetical protein [Nocardia pseudobrasiliensis]|uniref:Beta/gamma crystallin n=1 Tax=Nocardia pseudobrasiliensis TaxID=45979 RepID=A0A370I6Q7_9NOCA|nr:hypothetical protein [Nocardia pseudobrasiliensis]RDI66389.1 hypothetical protein DFR76_104135 [Nocardia pseudobrasiliensis]